MMTRQKTQFNIIILVLSLLLLSSASGSQATKNKKQTLLVVTPYPQFISQTYRSRFKIYYPDIELEVVKKGTSKAIKYLLKNREENIVDVFWASSPESFRKLQAERMLQAHKANTRGIPKVISGVQISDSNNEYTGYALSGYGFMWNTRYLKIKNLPVPKNWEDLVDSKYFNHICMSTPNNSGTTHVIIENILQTRGWTAGWELIKHITGNTKVLTKRSVHVPQKVQKGECGIGLVIDYYGLSSKAQHYPVDFAYPSPAILLPASAAIIKNAPNLDAAKHFIDFLVSPEGQTLLLDNRSRRIPILPATFDEAPEDYPNPYEDENLANTFDFDINLSVKRYDLINSMFDALISDNFTAFSQATEHVQQLEEALKENNNETAEQLLEQAKLALMWLPDINEEKSQNDSFLTSLKQDSGAMSDLQATWKSEAKLQYQKANTIAEQGLSILIK